MISLPFRSIQNKVVYLNSKTGLPFTEEYEPLAAKFVILGFAGNTVSYAVLLTETELKSLDIGEQLDHASYQALGLNAILQLPGFTASTIYTLLVDPGMDEVCEHIAALMSPSPVPSALCTYVIAKETGNTYIPDYLSLLRKPACS